MSKKTTKKKATPAKKPVKDEKKSAKAPEKKKPESKETVKKPKLNGKPPETKIPVQAHYDLKKVILESDNLGVTVNWTELPPNANSNSQDHISKTYAAIPHPDFIVAMGKLKYALLRSTGHMDIDRERKMKFNQAKFEYEPVEIKAWETLEKRLDIIHADKLMRTTITSLTISAKDESTIFNIQGKYKTDSGAIISLNSPQISSTGESFGCENEVYAMYQDIFDETWKYQFENKHAEAVEMEPNTGLFDKANQTVEEKEPVEQD